MAKVEIILEHREVTADGCWTKLVRREVLAKIPNPCTLKEFKGACRIYWDHCGDPFDRETVNTAMWKLFRPVRYRHLCYVFRCHTCGRIDECKDSTRKQYGSVGSVYW